MTQAYRCDETAVENQNDSKFSLEKKRISFTKSFSACDSRDSLFVCRWCNERSAAWRGLRRRQHRSCESNDAQRIPRGQCFRTRSAFRYSNPALRRCVLRLHDLTQGAVMLVVHGG